MTQCNHPHAHSDAPSFPRGDAHKEGSAARAAAVPFGVTPADETERRERVKRLKDLLEERIVLLDGAMGTMIQQHKLEERDFRGDRFRSYGRDIKGNNDILVLTQPEIIAGIHRAYLEAGADIIETNTFNSTSISQADYGMEALVPELNYRAARVAREAADQFAKAGGRPAFVAGAIGPTSRMASLSPDVNDPGYRSVTFDELVATYTEAARALV
ncbi:MAG: homocysteine S-methyltransferase family protein, partial [Sinobacteraceae bacterium]|nr:homocysteine S-methyltransferase family protein [Nevskiaceae bacterium]